MGDDDYAELCREQRTRRSRIREGNRQRALAEVDDGGWTKHTEVHWSRVVLFYKGGPYSARIDYWPSTDKMRIDDMSENVETETDALAKLKRIIPTIGKRVGS